jgi:tRNA(His) guanylyltransferase
MQAHMGEYIPEVCGEREKRPQFDCRAFSVPTAGDALEAIRWRRMDGLRNAVSSLTRSVYPHEAMHGKGSNVLLEMLAQRGLTLEDLSAHAREGTCVVRTKEGRPYTAEELDALPPRHAARTNPDLVVVRTVFRRVPFEEVGAYVVGAGAEVAVAMPAASEAEPGDA